MLVKFKDPDTLMSIEIDTKRQREMAHQEFLERRATTEKPGGGGPSEIFNQMRDDFMAKRKKHTDFLKKKILSGEGITTNDIQAAKTLEVIAVESRFDHKGAHCKGLVRGIERGEPSISGQSHATWKRMEIMASHHKQTDRAAPIDRVNISVSHTPINGRR